MAYPIHPKAGDYFLQGGRFGVLLTHGFSGSAYDLRELAEELHTQGWTVLVKRLAGHGTDPRDLAQNGIAEWRASLDEALHTLQEHCDKIAVIGNSFGGNLLTDLALRHPGQVSGIGLLSTPIFTYGEWWKRLVLPMLMRIKFSVKKAWVRYEGKADYLARGSYIEIPLRAYKQFLDFLKISRTEFSQVQIPVIMIYSSRDSVVKPHSAEFIYAALPSKQKRLYWVHDSYHSPLRSNDKSEVFRLLTDFVRSLH
ncbi:MAG: alpha/beta fold hydrolase [Candidatus Nomurabacteria bacterium]|nr:MAG: alpha/beta fold hydrolase [Candidatus Nomurabacteria bacterium]